MQSLSAKLKKDNQKRIRRTNKMTIKEAEKRYKFEVYKYKEFFSNYSKSRIKGWTIAEIITLVIGVPLLIIALCQPRDINSFGTEILSTTSFLFVCLSVPFLMVAVIVAPLCLLKNYIELKKGPDNLLPPTKNLYLNYLKCVDLPDGYKEFYKQKLEELRNAELVAALNNVNTTASTAILFSMLKK